MSGDVRQPRLIVDAGRCQGHNRCQIIVPELIEVDDHGFASVRGDGTVPAELGEKARLAVRNCPEFALRLQAGRDKGEDS